MGKIGDEDTEKRDYRYHGNLETLEKGEGFDHGVAHPRTYAVNFGMQVSDLRLPKGCGSFAP